MNVSCKSLESSNSIPPSLNEVMDVSFSGTNKTSHTHTVSYALHCIRDTPAFQRPPWRIGRCKRSCHPTPGRPSQVANGADISPPPNLPWTVSQWYLVKYNLYTHVRWAQQHVWYFENWTCPVFGGEKTKTYASWPRCTSWFLIWDPFFTGCQDVWKSSTKSMMEPCVTMCGWIC